MWHNDPFSQRNILIERTGGIGVCVCVFVWVYMGGGWSKFELKGGGVGNIGPLHKMGGQEPSGNYAIALKWVKHILKSLAAFAVRSLICV